jgi:hypothetical protein
MSLGLYIFFIVLMISYLCGAFGNYAISEISFDREVKQSLIELLTKHKSVTKNYRVNPSRYQYFNRNIIGTLIGEDVHFQYEFPLVGNHHHTLSYTLNSKTTSTQVDYYGVPSETVNKIDDNHIGLNPNLTDAELRGKMNQKCWFYESSVRWGVSYSALVSSYADFARPIAESIIVALNSKSSDSYKNRVQAALNFVQFIPYGIPHFDTKEWHYHELSVPPESFILSYADCDSKSVLMASILFSLIPKDRYVLIGCLVKSPNEKINGAHMVVGVSDLGIQGDTVEYNGKSFLLLETTVPWIIGKTDWEEIQILNTYAML